MDIFDILVIFNNFQKLSEIRPNNEYLKMKNVQKKFVEFIVYEKYQQLYGKTFTNFGVSFGSSKIALCSNFVEITPNMV